MTVTGAPQKRDGDYRRFAPFRIPSWRWKFALEHLRLNSRLRRWEDAGIKEATRYLWERQRAQTARQLSKVNDRWSDLIKAHVIFLADGVLRHELEARLVAGETVEIIATKSNTAAAVVVAFERYFFNVANVLHAIHWMMSFAIDLYPGLNRKPTERECWCYMGFAGGPLFVDMLVDDHLGRPNPKFPNLHEAAERARFFVRDYVTDWYSKRAGAATLRASRKLLGPHYGIPDEKLTPILKVAYRWLRIVYGLVPQRMSQRKIERIEASFAKNRRSIINGPFTPGELRQSAPVHLGPPSPATFSQQHPGSAVSTMSASAAAIQENIRQLLASQTSG